MTRTPYCSGSIKFTALDLLDDRAPDIHDYYLDR